MKNTFLLALISGCFLIISCKKDGCTDNLADNYDTEADNNDGSCKYTAGLVFYWDYDTWNYQLSPGGVLDLVFFVDGVNHGFMGADEYWSGSIPPSCNELFWTVNTSMSLGNNKSQTFNYSIKDLDTMTEVFGGTVTLTGGSCQTVKLE